jgi:hypothetical protein
MLEDMRKITRPLIEAFAKKLEQLLDYVTPPCQPTQEKDGGKEEGS